ncbi:Auxin-induced protein 15A [Heracleum sosnowskyi]|uniref:Auxin-induced protein 15A n=1 Tax=Heracleum sosnowskyi TaxID=360622 RepID=A0AAD8J6Q0_9APIA|nr:Auxin-induced protein 15A [Heracleum sosnowskyi]
MDDQRAGKVHGIRQVVRLKEIIQKWHHATIGHKAGHGNSSNTSPSCEISPDISKRLRGFNVYVDLDDESSQSLDPPQGVPKGYLAVYVGPELQTFKYLLKCMENHQKEHGASSTCAERSVGNKD